MLTTIANYLTALVQLIKQNHWTAKDYQDHLLFERLQDGINEDIDRVKEIALAIGYPDTITNAVESLESAIEILEDINDIVSLEKETISEINNIIKKLNSNQKIKESQYKEAIINMLGDIEEKRTRDLYLLQFRSSK